MGGKNYPPQQISNLGGEPIAEIVRNVSSIAELAEKGIPKDTEALKQRISQYFQFCGDHQIRLGIESLALALGTSRQNFFRWCSVGSETRGDEWQACCQQAKQAVIAFIEACALSGRLNPACYCFVMKNWANYADVVQVESLPEEKRASVSMNLPVYDPITNTIITREEKENE